MYGGEVNGGSYDGHRASLASSEKKSNRLEIVWVSFGYSTKSFIDRFSDLGKFNHLVQERI